ASFLDLVQHDPVVLSLVLVLSTSPVLVTLPALLANVVDSGGDSVARRIVGTSAHRDGASLPAGDLLALGSSAVGLPADLLLEVHDVDDHEVDLVLGGRGPGRLAEDVAGHERVLGQAWHGAVDVVGDTEGAGGHGLAVESLEVEIVGRLQSVSGIDIGDVGDARARAGGNRRDGDGHHREDHDGNEVGAHVDLVGGFDFVVEGFGRKGERKDLVVEVCR
ncbi:hypothetical protein BZA05DRAFT_451858, partial [Tricharina praecox]|uniref:uncharacterized protein n=1 Tax=Tricharina praecox TaxID=43433 RepID=UPI00221E6144